LHRNETQEKKYKEFFRSVKQDDHSKNQKKKIIRGVRAKLFSTLKKKK